MNPLSTCTTLPSVLESDGHHENDRAPLEGGLALVNLGRYKYKGNKSKEGRSWADNSFSARIDYLPSCCLHPLYSLQVLVARATCSALWRKQTAAMNDPRAVMSSNKLT
mmetsp:Transcript_2932/g.5403  ORF Transcript_2932/g.5403 Transcript_2932/m.5403 type:complete len:109 (-) Transcript_2932:976-1302(-)